MKATIKTQGRQFTVTKGDILKVNSYPNTQAGDSVELNEVLMVGEGETIKVGTPVVDGAKVSAKVVQHGRGDKVTILKFKRRKHHMKRQGHRQWFTEIKITAINIIAPKNTLNQSVSTSV